MTGSRRHTLGKILIIAALALLVICHMQSAGSASNHYVGYPDLVEPYEWIYGCSPTSAAMVLSYWDHYVSGIGKYTWYGSLIDYYVDIKEPKYGSVHNVPNTIVQLRDEMGTNKDTSSDGYGGTSAENIHTGIMQVTNSVNHYNFSSNQHGCSSSSCDWLWGTITNEIDHNRTFVWSVCTSGGGGRGHSTAAIGYTDDKYVIIYNTWDTAKHWWKYNQYDNTWAANYVQVDTVDPGGGTGPTEGQDILLDTPNGGETYTGGQSVTVWWYQWGSRIDTVKLYYFYGGEYSSPNDPTFHYIATRSSGEGWNSYSWTVPNVSSTKKMRLRINGKESSTGIYLAKDGSSNDFTVQPGDTTPPTPNPMTWSTEPHATDSSVAMTATTASDPSGVEYYFDETTGHAGGTDSGWQSSTSYTDSGLSSGTQYCYRVKARDKSSNHNETGWSTTECATTSDTTPPTPNPMTWSTKPHATDGSAAMVATTASDPSGVEYYFDETTGHAGGTDSGWQSSTSYTDSGLSSGTKYCYRVKARDKSSNHNETGWSTTECTYTGTAAKFRVTKGGDVLADSAYYCGTPPCWNAGHADIAEYINVSEPVEPGDLVELDPEKPGYYRKSRSPYSTLAGGVISTAPGMTMGANSAAQASPLPLSELALDWRDLRIGQLSQIQGGLSLGLALDLSLQTENSAGLIGLLSRYSRSESQALLALMGAVPVKATAENGPIRPGDLLVSAATPGYVMRCADLQKCEGAIVGKALEPLEEGIGVIKMLVMR